MSNQIPLTPPQSSPAQDFRGFRAWTIDALSSIYTILARRSNGMILEDTAAKKPAADGSQRFYFENDTKVPFYDDGAWQGPHLEVIATANLPAAAAAQNGRIVIEDAGVGNRNIVFYAGGERFRVDGGPNV